MKIDMNIDVHHVTRVEGHGNINVSVINGELKEAQWQVVETPRFFEAMLRGKSHDLAPTLTSRICGICSGGYEMDTQTRNELYQMRKKLNGLIQDIDYLLDAD